jgi:hypothetical protein
MSGERRRVSPPCMDSPATAGIQVIVAAMLFLVGLGLASGILSRRSTISN